MTPSILSRPSAAPWRREVRACVALSVPLDATNAVETATGLTGAALVGHIGPEALAAATLALALYNVALTFGIGLTAAVSPLIVGPIWLVLWHAEPILRAFGQDAALSRAAASCLRVMQWCPLPVLLYLSLRAMLAALERPRWAVMPGRIVRLFPDLGVPGAASAVRTAAVLLGVAGAFQIADGAHVVLAGMPRGLQDTRAPMVIAGVGYWCFGVAVAALLAPRYAAPGVWAGLVAGLFAEAAMLFWRWRSRP